MDEIYPVTRLEPGPEAMSLPKKLNYELPATFGFDGKNLNIREFIEFNEMEGMLILHNDTVIYEQYWDGFEPDDTHISWSVVKSIVSLLLGFAYQDGLFQLDEPITNYLPQFRETGYDNVMIRDIMQMSSGVRFNENYGDFYSDINRFGRAFAMGSSLEDFSRSLENERKPGTYCKYVSIDTQVLGMLLKKITGQSLTDYFQLKLWNPLGMEDQAEWIIDNTGMEVALGGLNMTLRDYAKIGQFVLDEGHWKEQQLLSKDWIRLSITPDAPHLMPGKQPNSNNIQGYGFQWWIPEIDEGDFYATGIYDQYIYIQPAHDVVIVVLSANYHFNERALWGKRPHIALFKSIAEDLGSR
jgi:CubicO group peptidase (beta-lactamase class C family)